MSNHFALTKMKISAVIVAHNEEKHLRDCLKSLDFVDEIVVVLDKCTDKSKEIALEFTTNIVEGKWNIEGARRNVGLERASGDWILEIDADERISPKLATEIKDVAKNSKPCGYDIKIANYIGKHWVKYGWLRTLGVLKRESLTYKGLKKYDEDKEIHPTFKLNGEVKTLQNPIIHYVDENIADFIARFNRYTNWKANDMIAKNKIKGGFFYLLFNFKIRFVKSYFIKQGFRECRYGLLMALFAGLYPIISYLKAKEKLENENS